MRKHEVCLHSRPTGDVADHPVLSGINQFCDGVKNLKICSTCLWVLRLLGTVTKFKFVKCFSSLLYDEVEPKLWMFASIRLIQLTLCSATSICLRSGSCHQSFVVVTIFCSVHLVGLQKPDLRSWQADWAWFLPPSILYRYEQYIHMTLQKFTIAASNIWNHCIQCLFSLQHSSTYASPIDFKILQNSCLVLIDIYRRHLDNKPYAKA